MKTVTIIGAGFAGLTLAHYLIKEGFECVIFEKQDRTGGLIGTSFKDYGQAEWAANALLANAQVEDLFSELGLEFADRTGAARKRFIYWEEPKRWPLTWSSSWLAARRLFSLFLLGNSDLVPDAGESVADWCERVFNREILERMVAPALQGIYAGDVRQMSATLLFKSMSAKRPERRSLKGSVAPLGGMGELLSALTKSVVKTGRCEIRLKSSFSMPEYITTPLVLSTSAWGASEILANSHPELSRALKVCPSVPLARATVFFPKHPRDLEGFGCLFPASQSFSSLGVLFDSSIFPSRSNVRSESWMLGGALNPDVVTWSDEQVIQTILRDRERLLGVTTEPLQYHIQRWPRAIPHYTCAWESALKSLRVAPPLYLHGNYLGQIGLARILERSMTLAQDIKDSYGD